jgi:hypothetical protein
LIDAGESCDGLVLLDRRRRAERADGEIGVGMGSAASKDRRRKQWVCTVIRESTVTYGIADVDW